MNCVCYNLMNTLQNHLGTLISTLVNNRLNSGTPSSDDGAYQPNFNLLNQNDPGSFDSNALFYICMTILAIVTLSSIISSRRRRRFGGNGSSLH